MIPSPDLSSFLFFPYTVSVPSSSALFFFLAMRKSYNIFIVLLYIRIYFHFFKKSNVALTFCQWCVYKVLFVFLFFCLPFFFSVQAPLQNFLHKKWNKNLLDYFLFTIQLSRIERTCQRTWSFIEAKHTQHFLFKSTPLVIPKLLN